MEWKRLRIELKRVNELGIHRYEDIIRPYIQQQIPHQYSFAQWWEPPNQMKRYKKRRVAERSSVVHFNSGSSHHQRAENRVQWKEERDIQWISPKVREFYQRDSTLKGLALSSRCFINQKSAIDLLFVSINCLRKNRRGFKVKLYFFFSGGFQSQDEIPLGWGWLNWIYREQILSSEYLKCFPRIRKCFRGWNKRNYRDSLISWVSSVCDANLCSRGGTINPCKPQISFIRSSTRKLFPSVYIYPTNYSIFSPKSLRLIEHL